MKSNFVRFLRSSILTVSIPCSSENGWTVSTVTMKSMDHNLQFFTMTGRNVDMPHEVQPPKSFAEVQQRFSLDSIWIFCLDNVLQDGFSFGTVVEEEISFC